MVPLFTVVEIHHLRFKTASFGKIAERVTNFAFARKSMLLC
jgi:hypothetical protein